MELQDIQAERTGLIFFLTVIALNCHVAIPSILGPVFFSPKVTRHPVFINWCLTLEFSSVTYLVLLYAGEIENPLPHFGACLVQASMIYASAAMLGTSSLIFSIHIYRVVRRTAHARPPRAWHTPLLVIKLGTPYAIYLTVFIMEIVFGRSHKQQVHRSRFYCVISASIAHVGPGIAVVAAAGTVVLQVLTVITLCRYWKVFKAVKGHYERGVDLSLIIRSIVVTVLAFVATLICLAFITELSGPGPNLALAILFLLFTLVFATQGDILKVYRCSKHPGRDESSNNGIDQDVEKTNATTC